MVEVSPVPSVDSLRKDGRPQQLRVRLTRPERHAFGLAADLNGLNLSNWARSVLRKAAIVELRAAGLDEAAEGLMR